LAIVSYGVLFLEEYGMIIQIQSVVSAISTTIGYTVPNYPQLVLFLRESNKMAELLSL
jgi:hypothetical protein